jgi:two-component system phosphate regulon sensor histidine kinase PhoR
MNDPKYRWILYLISSVILVTLCIQVYWNYKNYEIGKQQLINDVQASIDQAVDNYYTELAKSSSFKFIGDSIGFSTSTLHDTLFINTDSIGRREHFELRVDASNEGPSIRKSSFKDSKTIKYQFIDSSNTNWTRSSIERFLDSISNPIEELSSKIIIAITEDDFSLKRVDSLFIKELNRKNSNIDYGLTLEGFLQKNDTLYPSSVDKAELKVTTSSPYFLHNSSLTVHFGNIMVTVFKKNMFGIFLSFLLVISIIGSLLYLLNIIKKQKQLSEVKNDLISNITHEFKTPIATIGIAMEALQKFNGDNDAEKSKRYAKISTEQVNKLNLMVEKLLETATLDSSHLDLNFEKHDLVELLRKAANQEVLDTNEKRISFHSPEKPIPYDLDVFHFENAINNIIDNAIKYGGHEISVSIDKTKSDIVIKITDSGNSLNSGHKKEIFHKFYRVPTGNTHNVKGFGIGLYYSKKIIEKHGGTISLEVNRNTTFKINLPNV